MINLILGIASSAIVVVIVLACEHILFPYIRDRVLYRGIRLDGLWEICETRNEQEMVVGELTLRQQGSRIKGESRRTQTRSGDESNRRFKYTGRIAGEQLTLLFEDAKGRDFDSGTYVFRVHNNCLEMKGMATFSGKAENRIISEPRTLKKLPS